MAIWIPAEGGEEDNVKKTGYVRMISPLSCSGVMDEFTFCRWCRNARLPYVDVPFWVRSLVQQKDGTTSIQFIDMMLCRGEQRCHRPNRWFSGHVPHCGTPDNQPGR